MNAPLNLLDVMPQHVVSSIVACSEQLDEADAPDTERWMLIPVHLIAPAARPVNGSGYLGDVDRFRISVVDIPGSFLLFGHPDRPIALAYTL